MSIKQLHVEDLEGLPYGFVVYSDKTKLLISGADPDGVIYCVNEERKCHVKLKGGDLYRVDQNQYVVAMVRHIMGVVDSEILSINKSDDYGVTYEVLGYLDDESNEMDSCVINGVIDIAPWTENYSISQDELVTMLQRGEDEGESVQ